MHVQTLLLILAVGCASEPAPAPVAAPTASPAASAPAAPTPATPTTYGDAFDPGTPVSATDLVHAADTWNGKEVVVTGTIRQVCQAKGCWHRLATDDAKADVLVKASRYHIFLPKDSAGRTAVVKGTFTRAPMPLDEARHLAQDAGQDPNLVTEPPMTFGIDAVGVQLL